ncbi:BMP family ABC transporter substrate-binding protein [Kyrpidia spormannii]|uniref:Purine-binding protein BAB2_0673 n=2 Tax=Kyrpidia spormannii TaxID=2055160 RepID=A0ACA8Z7B1_9BACL|nr:BMP family ABC transporter substrate-binding protein [Kyrpidia spormannii]CAB3391376.1 Purine-binding protein BAB2_0673 [Kyrpidia spormannii]CAB3392289.1 Purine-binding protein BAB2_0673 [Kyrpidia spormannii]
MKQRGLIRWLSLLLGLVLIAGCSQAGVATQSSSQAGAASGQGIKKPRVAFVYLGPPGDGGWTYQHDQGRKYLENQLGIKADYVENVPESADAERVLTQLAQNHDIIFATSFGYQDYVYDVAQKFPHVIFMHCAGYKTAPNMGTYFGRNYQASYLAGVAAGKMTKKNLLGYVGAFPIPEVIYNINAFTRGAQSVNPKVKVKVVWSNTWFDPATERQAANSLLDQGVDVVAAYQDSPASLQAAQERGAYAIGNDSDMGRYVPDAYITNPVWNWGPYYVKVVKEVMDGTWKSGQYLGGLKDGMVGLAPFGKNVPQDVQNLVGKDKAEITAGKLDPFQGPIYDASGKLQVPAGSKLTDQQILSMNWFVQGVEGTIPK